MRLRFVARDGLEVVFREPRPTDAPQLMKFINEFVSEPMSGILIDSKVRLKDERDWLKGWLAMIKGRKGVLVLVEADGEIRGSCSVQSQKWKSSHVADFGIALSREIRGKGIGEELMKQTIALARRRIRGLELLQLKAFSYNERALGIYRKLGFFQVGRVPGASKEQDEYFDDILMVKKLK